MHKEIKIQHTLLNVVKYYSQVSLVREHTDLQTRPSRGCDMPDNTVITNKQAPQAYTHTDTNDARTEPAWLQQFTIINKQQKTNTFMVRYCHENWQKESESTIRR